MNISQRFSCKGYSLVELMVSMVIGLFLVAGVFTIYLNGRSAQRVVDDQVMMLDNGRFALETISYDLRHAGLWARTNEYASDAASSNFSTDLLGAIPGECEGGWVAKVTAPVAAFNDSNPYALCVLSYGQGDVLEARYSLGAPVADADLQPGLVYVNGDVNLGSFFVGTASPNVTAIAQNYQVISNLYYVSNSSDAVGDGIPSLRRVSLEPGPQVVDRLILSGVEDLQVQYGLDTDDDGLVNTYLDPHLVPTTNWTNVRTVQVTIVIRSQRNYPDLDTSFTANVNGLPVDFPNDGFRRHVLSTVVKLRNHKNTAGI